MRVHVLTNVYPQIHSEVAKLITRREKSKVIVDNVDVSGNELAHKLHNDYSDLSFKSVGIFYYLKDRGSNWTFDEKDLYNRFKDGKTAVRGGIKELKNHGIITEEPYQIAGSAQGKKWILSL